MNATDVERLVPHLGCHHHSTNEKEEEKSSRCIELLQSSTSSLTSNSSEIATACQGASKELLCHNLKQSKCQENDVICQLMHKVRNYLRTHYDEHQQPKKQRPSRPISQMKKVTLETSFIFTKGTFHLLLSAKSVWDFLSITSGIMSS